MKRQAKLILGGGAAFGLSHIGAIKAIEEEYVISGIVGTSMGAIVGGLYAMGKTPVEILDIARESKSDIIFNPHILPMLPKIFPFNLFKITHSGKNALNIFNVWTQGARIENLPIPFVAVAFDLKQGISVLLDKGSLASAMRASSSLPLLFAPYVQGKYQFVDGGIEHPLPVAFGDSVPGEVTIAVNVLPAVSTKAESFKLNTYSPKHKIKTHQVVIRSIMQNQGFVAIQSMLQRPPDLFIDAHNPEKGMFDLFDADDFYEFGYQTARETLDRKGEPKFMEQLLKRYQSLIGRFVKNRREAELGV
jgi:NTE family protein